MIKGQDLEQFRGQYPYGSELFGVYQTLLGWRGVRIQAWFAKGFVRDLDAVREAMFRRLRADVDARPNEDQLLTRIGHIGIGTANDKARFGSKLVEALAARLPGDGNHDDPAFWREALADEVLTSVLNRDVREAATDMLKHAEIGDRVAAPAGLRPDAALARANPAQTRTERVLRFLDEESRMAGQLRLLRDSGAVGELQRVFINRNTTASWLGLQGQLFSHRDPFAPLDPPGLVSRTVISPIGLIHLFRQYFFELDSFLGSPVGHVWVAPGTTVELVEINSRRTLTEATVDEAAFSHIEQFGESFSLEDLHEAVTRTNRQDLSFGASVSGSHSWIVGSVQASASMNYHRTQTDARLTVHDLMRRQTERVSSLMDRSVHTTFKTVTETTEVSSKKYVVTNTTDELLNYELRRKMRRVAVQVQDVGTYLSWQTFVDDPGRELGVANLVHIAEPPNLANIPHPQMIVPKPPKTTNETVVIPYQPISADEDDNDQRYVEGMDVDRAPAYDGMINSRFPQQFRAPDKDYRLAAVKPTPLGDAKISIKPDKDFVEKNGYFQFTVRLDEVHFHDAPSMVVQLDLTWQTTEDLDKINAENDKRLSTFIAEQKRAFEDAYVKAARERIKLASTIASRRYEDLRQEERIAVFRRLVRSLAPGRYERTVSGKAFSYPYMSDQTRHAWSEILNRMFDLEKMLYFVAPEWWKPRPRSFQVMGTEEPMVDENENVVLDANGNVVMQPANRTPISDRSVVSWGGGAEAGRPNYYITENSAPAHLGSSLGWLLQLDGDSMRNAFLNAPWVKAIVPIRPGMETEAKDWLKDVVEGNEGLTPALEAELTELAKKVTDKHKQAATVQDFPDLIDPDQTVPATPVDRVFEFGFDPLQRGFRAQSFDGNEFEIIDQWIEVVPTDQVAAVAVAYDPVTGRQLQPS